MAYDQLTADLLSEANKLQEQRDNAVAAVTRVLGLHDSYSSSRGVECVECLAAFPCRTVLALQGVVEVSGPRGALRERPVPTKCLACKLALSACTCHDDYAGVGRA